MAEQQKGTDRLYTRRDRKPRIRDRGVRCRWSDARGHWVFRAVRSIDGRRRVGPWRDSATVAAVDYATLNHVAATLPTRVLTLAEACELVAQDRIADGVSEADVEASTRAHARFLFGALGPSTRLAQITVDDVVELVQRARRGGRSPNTLIEKDLPLLARACRVAGVPDVVKPTRERLRGTLKKVPPQMRFFTPAEIAALLVQMRTATVRTRSGAEVPVPERERDADLVELLACTGVRWGELLRLKVADFDASRATLDVRVAKDRSHPRTLPLAGSLLEAVQRLAARAREDRPSTPTDSLPLLVGGKTTLGNIFARWKRRLQEPRLCGRTLRHSFTSGLFVVGGAATDAAALAGHRRMSTTDRYSHAIRDRLGNVAASWVAHVTELAAAQHPGSPHPEPTDPPAPACSAPPNAAGPTPANAAAAE